ncbi:MAG: galactose mutarotase [Clostridia bacterium]|nr:galactose mutarotase [Clostridia bacterium]
MSVTVYPFGHMPDGRTVDKVTLTNGSGTSVSVLTYGATVQSLFFDDKDIVLGFDTLDSYFTSDAYIGATVGRVCNRIADGRFTLNGNTYQLACNEAARGVHLHGGTVGFDKKIWDYAILSHEKFPSVRFSLHSEDGEEGYPGQLDVSVVFSLSEDNTLSLSYEAKGDKDTPVNLTNHTYFNLNGCNGADVSGTLLSIEAEEFTPVNSRLIPTGEFCSVAGTALDFRAPRPMGDTFRCEDPIVAGVGGVDHNFVLAHGRRPLSKAVEAFSPLSRIRMSCCTDLPGVQIYTANATNENSGKYGLSWKKHSGFCVETQYFPDSVNQTAFPSVILPAGVSYTSCTTFHFDIVEE